MDTITIEKKEYPFLFAIKAQREMSNADLEKKDDIYFIYLGLKYGSKKEGKEFPFTEDALLDIFENDLGAYEKACGLLGAHMGKLKKLKEMALQGLQ